MLLVVFGAGASFDSAPLLRPGTLPEQETWRPPLANDLFGDRPGFREEFASFPQVLPLATRLGQASPSHPLERLMTGLRDEADEYPERYSQLAAVRYYLQKIIWECERYWLEQHRAATSIDSYIQHPHFPIIKLHGSIDWGYRVDTPLSIVAESSDHVWQIAAEVIKRFADLQISTEIEKTVQRPPQPQNGNAYVPALAIPLDQKTDFACPPSHLEFLQERLPSVSHLLAIGWRGTEAHFCEMLRRGLPSGVAVTAVSGTLAASEETLLNLRTAGIGSAWEAIGDGFADLVVSLDLGTFLDQAIRD